MVSCPLSGRADHKNGFNNMTGFKYETHLHTSETSKCGDSSGAELADYYHARGYTGVFVTDHFLNGNHTVPPDLPWPQRVALFCRGYEETAQRGVRIGLEVFFAWEYSYGWAHFLTYGLDQQWLLAHPEVLDWDVLEYFDRVRADGTADRARLPGVPQAAREVAVGYGPPVAYPEQFTPYRKLEGASIERQRNVESRPLSAKITRKLSGSFPKHRV